MHHINLPLVVVLALLVVVITAGLPRWPHAQAWGDYPGGFVGLVLIVIIVLLLLGVL